LLTKQRNPRTLGRDGRHPPRHVLAPRVRKRGRRAPRTFGRLRLDRLPRQRREGGRERASAEVCGGDYEDPRDGSERLCNAVQAQQDETKRESARAVPWGRSKLKTGRAEESDPAEISACSPILSQSSRAAPPFETCARSSRRSLRPRVDSTVLQSTFSRGTRHPSALSLSPAASRDTTQRLSTPRALPPSSTFSDKAPFSSIHPSDHPVDVPPCRPSPSAL